MTDSYDAIIIGGGHNGLVCGAYLARAGLTVAVVERAPAAGGCIASASPPDLPGYTLDIGGLEHGRLWGSRVVAELDLERHGLDLVTRDVYAAAVFPDGRAIAIAHDLDATCASIATVSPADAAAYRRFVAAAAGVLDLLAAAGDGPPPSPLALLRLGRVLPPGTRMDACLRLFLQSPRAVLDDWFESDELKALLGNFATHSQLPPWQSGAGYMPMLMAGAHRGRPARPRGGSGAFVASLTRALRAAGGDLLTGNGVARVLVERGRAVGVRLDDGAELRATRAVVSAVDARRLFLDLMAPGDAPAYLRDEARRIRVGVDNVGEMSMGVALAGLPDFGPALAGPALAASLYLAPTLRAVEEAFLDIARGDLPARPALMWALPSLTDPSLAPPGGQTLWIAAFVPWRLRDGRSWDDAREEMADRLLAALSAQAPGLPSLVRGRVVLSPLDWARRTGNLVGSADHVDMTLDQMLGNRPSPHLAHYRTPIHGLYLTGAGTHPGGGISGVPARNTARVVLRDVRGVRDAGRGGWEARRIVVRDMAGRAALAVRGWRELDRLAGALGMPHGVER